MVSGTREKKTGKIRLGMVGGGQGAFIGAVHRLAARMDDEYEFVAGALSADAAKAKASGQDLGLAPDRIYTSYEEMAKAEAKRPDGIEVVSIVTPNHVHVPAAKAFINAGIHVICDKPLALSLKEAKSLEALLAKRKDVIFALTHNYSGYPMIRHAKAMVKAGDPRHAATRPHPDHVHAGLAWTARPSSPAGRPSRAGTLPSAVECTSCSAPGSQPKLNSTQSAVPGCTSSARQAWSCSTARPTAP